MRKLGFSGVGVNSSQLVTLELRKLTLDNGDETTIAPVFLGILDFPPAVVGVYYSFNASFLFNSAGDPDLYALATGSMINGMAFNTLNCVIDGTPTDNTDLTGISFSASNAAGTSLDSNIDTLVVNDPPADPSVFNGVWVDSNIWDDSDIWVDTI